jgi:hypothetical protein
LGAQEKVPKEKGDPVHSSAGADALRSSPLRGRAQLAISRCSIRSDRVRAMFPDGLRYSVSADGNRTQVPGLGFDFQSVWRSRASQPFLDGASRPVELDLLAVRRGKSCEFGERPKWREAQGTRFSG